MEKDFILAEIRRTAELNGGKALGHRRFCDETGIREADWKARHWIRWNDAVREAGLSPNELRSSHSIDSILDAYARFALELGELPVVAQIRMRRRSDPSFPSWEAIKRRGGKSTLIPQLAEYCRSRLDFKPVFELCERVLQTRKHATTSDSPPTRIDGSVYLAKTCRGYKIGRTDDWEQRLRQIQLHNADDVQLVHLIKTDDPSGVEAYWHRRFKSKRVVAKSKTGRRRNWYNLSADDVRAFKRWSKI